MNTEASSDAGNDNIGAMVTEDNPTLVKVFRDPTTRPIYCLSIKLIDTYKYINKVYYEAKAKKLRDQQGSNREGVCNDGYDDHNYDYIVHGDEIFAERYILKHRIGKVNSIRSSIFF